MRTVIVNLCFILLGFLNSIELARPHKEDAVHPLPIELHVRHYEGFFSTRNLRAGICFVETDKEQGQEYIIGVIIRNILRPFLAPRADLYNDLGRVKVRIDGNIANVTMPISKEDPMNHLFHKAFGSQNIRAAEIRE